MTILPWSDLEHLAKCIRVASCGKELAVVPSSVDTCLRKVNGGSAPPKLHNHLRTTRPELDQPAPSVYWTQLGLD